MEPVSVISTAILSQFQTSTFIGSVIGGIVGNRADAALYSATRKIYERVNDQVNEPETRDIQKAVRRSYLNATLIAVDRAKSKFRYRNHNPSDFTEIENYLQSELKKLEKSDIKFPDKDLDEEFQVLIKPDERKAEQQLPDMINNLKESLFEEFRKQELLVGPTLQDHIKDGWRENGQKRDWYELLCAFFADEMRANDRLANTIQHHYLQIINTDIVELTITTKSIKEKLALYFNDYKSLLPKVESILTTVGRTEEKIDELHDKIQQIAAEGGKRR